MRCFYCCKPLSLLAAPGALIASKDHKTPVSRGGSDLIDNIVPACIPCNSRKGDMTEEEFRKSFSKAFEILTKVAASEREMSLEERDEPKQHLLRKESESVSWAWRHPHL